MDGWANPSTFALGDGVLTYWNNYDHQVYAVGQGPSSTTVSIANDVVQSGNSVMITGNVIDNHRARHNLSMECDSPTE